MELPIFDLATIANATNTFQIITSSEKVDLNLCTR
jgi:hypothetical protein